jgi:hypothetical protein
MSPESDGIFRRSPASVGRQSMLIASVGLLVALETIGCATAAMTIGGALALVVAKAAFRNLGGGD